MFQSTTSLAALTIGRFVRHYTRSPLRQLVVQCLPTRSILRIAGATASDYLQGLITNDMKHIKEGSPCMFAMFLNTKGRVLYDSIIYRGGDEDAYFIECDTAVVKDLESHLKMYKVRRKISIDALHSEYSIWTVNSKEVVDDIMSNIKPSVDPLLVGKSIISDLNKVQNIKAATDPRVASIGIRVVAPNNVDIVSLLKQSEVDVSVSDYYRFLRFKLGVGEGVTELPIGNCFPLEGNCDYLHGVSFHKGCYIGQELTARTYHTGVIRKRLMPLVYEEKPSDLQIDSPVTADSGKAAGKLRGCEGINGIALLRVEEVLKSKYLDIGGKRCETWRPFWWPSEAPKERPG